MLQVAFCERCEQWNRKQKKIKKSRRK